MRFANVRARLAVWRGAGFMALQILRIVAVAFQARLYVPPPPREGP